MLMDVAMKGVRKDAVAATKRTTLGRHRSGTLIGHLCLRASWVACTIVDRGQCDHTGPRREVLELMSPLARQRTVSFGPSDRAAVRRIRGTLDLLLRHDPRHDRQQPRGVRPLQRHQRVPVYRRHGPIPVLPHRPRHPRMRTVASALAESDARFRSYVESAPIAILVFDEDGRCIGLQPGGLACWHRRQTQSHAPAAAAGHPAGGAATASSKAADDRIEFARAGRDGKQIWIQLRAVQHRGAQTLLFCQDITERVRAEEELRATNERLLQAGKDGGGRTTGRRRGARLQQHPHRHLRVQRHSPGLCRPGRRRALPCRRSARRPSGPPPSPSSCSRSAGGRRCFPAPVDLNELLGNLVPMLARLIGEDVEMALDLAERFGGADGLWTVRVDPARVEQALREPGRERARRHAEGRHAQDRDEQRRLGGDRSTTPPRRRRVTSCSRDGHRHGHRDGRRDPVAPVRAVLYHQGRRARARASDSPAVYGIVKQSGGVVTVATSPCERQHIHPVLSPCPTGRFQTSKSRGELRPLPRSGDELILYVEDDEAVRGR